MPKLDQKDKQKSQLSIFAKISFDVFIMHQSRAPEIVNTFKHQAVNKAITKLFNTKFNIRLFFEFLN